jgi:proteasome lid subunit RPN8/RPN11
MIAIPADAMTAILAHAEADFPHEACGLLVGRDDPDGARHVEVARALPNTREAEARHHRFLIAPADLVREERRVRAEGREIVGFYHSHPDHPAVPSRHDLEQAWPLYSYLVVAVRAGRAEQALSWRLSDDRARFDPEELVKGARG